MRAAATFSDPSDASVTITLIGKLSEFEDLRADLVDGRVPYYRVSNLVEQISDASRRLRYRVDAPVPPRPMLPGDLGL